MLAGITHSSKPRLSPNRRAFIRLVQRIINPYSPDSYVSSDSKIAICASDRFTISSSNFRLESEVAEISI